MISNNQAIALQPISVRSDEGIACADRLDHLQETSEHQVVDGHCEQSESCNCTLCPSITCCASAKPDTPSAFAVHGSFANV